jgi:hypothetical protein
MSSFFSHFPTVLYGNNAVTNIIAKVKFQESVQKNLAVFYSYTVKEGERPDQIAESYYEDSSYDWLIYFSNDIVDPYHEWPRSQEEMERLIVTKYGTVANASLQKAFYRTNYQTDDRVISTAAFNALPAGAKQYWQPIIGYNEAILNYQRKEQDLMVETNALVTLTGTFNEVPTTSSVVKYKLQQDPPSGAVVGTVAFANTTTVILKHINGVWSTGNFMVYAGNNASINATITTANVTTWCIPQDELTYWSPVTYFEYEYEINEAKRNIQLVSSVYVNKIERDMKELLQQ